MFDLLALEKSTEEKVFLGLFYNKNSEGRTLYSIYKLFFIPSTKEFETRIYYGGEDKDVPEMFYSLDIDNMFRIRQTKEEHAYNIELLESMGVYDIKQIKLFLDNYNRIKKDKDLMESYERNRLYREQQAKKVEDLKEAGLMMDSMLSERNPNKPKKRILQRIFNKSN